MRKNLLAFGIAVSAGLGTCWADADFRADGTLNRPGEVEYEVERRGAPSEPLEVVAMVVGPKADGALDKLLVSEKITVIPSKPSKAKLTVSEDNFREWSQTYKRITAAFEIVPNMRRGVDWDYKNLIDPSNPPRDGKFHVHGRWVPH